jgi:hypothetical protein
MHLGGIPPESLPVSISVTWKVRSRYGVARRHPDSRLAAQSGRESNASEEATPMDPPMGHP